MTTPCTCPEHRAGAPTVIGEHEFACENDEAVTVSLDLFEVWRWLCACGARGGWQIKGNGATYHGWRRHVESFGQEG